MATGGQGGGDGRVTDSPAYKNAKVDAQTRPHGWVAEADRYPQNALEGFQSGCTLDLRVRLANDYLRSPALEPVVRAVLNNVNPIAEAGSPGDPGMAPAWIARFALDLADQVLAQGKERGLVSHLPDTSELSGDLKRQAERNGKFGFAQQQAGQRAAQAAASGVVPVAGVIKPTGH